MNRKTLKACVAAVAGALVLGSLGGAASAMQDERKHPGQPKYGDISVEKRGKKSAAEAEARINASEREMAAMAAAAKSRNVAQARSILLRNGFTPDQLEGVPIRFDHSGGGGGGAERIKSIEIKFKCCPPELIIIIKF